MYKKFKSLTDYNKNVKKDDIINVERISDCDYNSHMFYYENHRYQLSSQNTKLLTDLEDNSLFVEIKPQLVEFVSYDDFKNSDSDNNNGLEYGLTYLDNEGIDIIDIAWFANNTSRLNFAIKNYLKIVNKDAYKIQIGDKIVRTSTWLASGEINAIHIGIMTEYGLILKPIRRTTTFDSSITDYEINSNNRNSHNHILPYDGKDSLKITPYLQTFFKDFNYDEIELNFEELETSIKGN